MSVSLGSLRAAWTGPWVFGGGPRSPETGRCGRARADPRGRQELRAGRRLSDGQQPCEVRGQRLLRDSQERGLEPQYAFLDTGQAGPRISPRLDASEISEAGLPPAAFYQQMAREHRNRVLTLDVRRRLMAHERQLPACAH